MPYDIVLSVYDLYLENVSFRDWVSRSRVLQFAFVSSTLNSSSFCLLHLYVWSALDQHFCTLGMMSWKDPAEYQRKNTSWHEKNCVDTNWEFLRDNPQVIMDSTVPSKLSKGKRHLPWITTDLKRKMRKRDALYKKACHTHTGNVMVGLPSAHIVIWSQS